jgi:hypothetical protein
VILEKPQIVAHEMRLMVIAATLGRQVSHRGSVIGMRQHESSVMWKREKEGGLRAGGNPRSASPLLASSAVLATAGRPSSLSRERQAPA